ncbi:hypothetical protein F5Y00DRAFT_260793 [Daldinia vernicosa]|uniref:uncharacterized protein n=1 Tax=Daldinia vernicosa TaxID=114800 RepID=UPI0020072AAE|nr:uncharacterized protein F5Y00DRAFT_260793 [Daldinia vernicosa]KAI0850061.1 hypothetical protein F5Y00DRAFT_260793 [Daldinia vernicosa]
MPSTGDILQPSGKPLLYSIPNELILEIIELLSPLDASNFALSSQHLFKVFNKNKESILITVLKRLPEINILLYVYTAHKGEFKNEPTLCPRIIEYARENYTVNLMELGDASREFPNRRDFKVPKYTLTTQQVEQIWNMAKVIDWWVEKYPRLHWRDNSDDRRCLRDSEIARVRKAVARWWLYAKYHHGNAFARFSVLHPSTWTVDTRLHHIRLMPTSEISELWHLWRLVRETVSKDLCSSPEKVCHCKQGYSVELVPWGAGEGRRHAKIVKTYMKLDPEQLRYYLSHYANWKKSVTISSLSDLEPNFARDSETLSISLSRVLGERKIYRGVQSWADMPQFGIVDEDRPSELHDTSWLDDAWPDGRVPPLPAHVLGFPFDSPSIVPRGDDGTETFFPF